MGLVGRIEPLGKGVLRSPVLHPPPSTSRGCVDRSSCGRSRCSPAARSPAVGSEHPGQDLETVQVLRRASRHTLPSVKPSDNMFICTGLGIPRATNRTCVEWLSTRNLTRLRPARATKTTHQGSSSTTNLTRRRPLTPLSLEYSPNLLRRQRSTSNLQPQSLNLLDGRARAFGTDRGFRQRPLWWVR